MEYLSLKKEGHIGIITLDRPPVNALNYQAYSEIFEVFELVAQDPEIWCVIFQAKNKLFCAGNDLNELDETAQSGAEDTHEIPYGDMVEKGLTSVIKCKVPVITCVHSTAVGAGFCIATYSDIVLAAPEAKFGITEVTVGIIGGGPEASHSPLHGPDRQSAHSPAGQGLQHGHGYRPPGSTAGNCHEVGQTHHLPAALHRQVHEGIPEQHLSPRSHC